MAYFGTAKFGEDRFGMTEKPTTFDMAIELAKTRGDMSIVWRQRIYGPTDPETGQRTYSFVESTIDAIVNEVQKEHAVTAPGVEPAKTIVIQAREGVKHLDQLRWNGDIYEVVSVPVEVKIADKFQKRVIMAVRMQKFE